MSKYCSRISKGAQKIAQNEKSGTKIAQKLLYVLYLTIHVYVGNSILKSRVNENMHCSSFYLILSLTSSVHQNNN